MLELERAAVEEESVVHSLCEMIAGKESGVEN